MKDYVFIVIALLIGFGMVFIRKSRPYGNHLSLRWIGYALLLMSVFLIIFIGIINFSQGSHGYGH